MGKKKKEESPRVAAARKELVAAMIEDKLSVIKPLLSDLQAIQLTTGDSVVELLAKGARLRTVLSTLHTSVVTIVSGNRYEEKRSLADAVALKQRELFPVPVGDDDFDDDDDDDDY